MPCSVDVIERAKTPTREDALAARLGRLRELSSANKSPPATEQHPRPRHGYVSEEPQPQELQGDDEADAVFRTDDDTLEELLGADLDRQPSPYAAATQHPSDDQVRALLEELAAAIPKDENEEPVIGGDPVSDDSDEEQITRETDEVIAKFQDELELDTGPGHGEVPGSPQSRGPDEQVDEEDGQVAEAQTQPRQEDDPLPFSGLTLPSLPSDLPSLPSTIATPPSTTSCDDIVMRMAALRASSSSPPPSFPSVPTSRPAAAVPRRLTSRTAYTDDDVDSWCTVCLTDATLRCRGCDDDPYCSRCWWEMHLGPSASFDERSHKAVQFTGRSTRETKKTALGAS